jgi:hypothetical protein
VSDIIDFDQVVREIEDEVAARRASGDFPADLERQLDLVFARFAPAAASGDDLDAVLAAADRASFVDVDVPTGSNIPGVAPLKRGLRKLMEWYLRYLAQQVSELATSWAAALKLLAGRVKALEAAGGATDPAGDDSRHRADPAAVSPFESRIAEALAGTEGRVLVGECGDGALVRLLVGEGLDAYGVDPDPARAQSAVAAGSEVRAGDALEHLRGVAEARLGGLVLCACVDRLALAFQVELAGLAAATLADGGRVVVVSTSPGAWARASDVVTTDLSPGRPLHAATWRALLERRGFVELADHDGPPLVTLQAVPPGEGAEVLNANLAHIEEALFGPASYVVTGVRRR